MHYGQYGNGYGQPPYRGAAAGNGGDNGYNGHYMSRPPVMGKLNISNSNLKIKAKNPSAVPPHPSERHALDLAGSREQRGSAFELYRKPQIGAAGHHHNMR